MNIALALIYLLFAPLLGGLLAGLDRKISARMQGRFGPPILQPFYDVFKLFEKERQEVRTAPRVFAVAFLIFTILRLV
jgi:ech hydrogenase subunit B